MENDDDEDEVAETAGMPRGLLSLTTLTQLQFLDLSTSNVIDKDLEFITALRLLSVVKLSDCLRLTGKFLQNLSHATNIRALYIEGCKNLKPDKFSYLAPLTSLTLLEISRTNIDNSGMMNLTGLTNLQTLHVQENNSITDIALSYLRPLISLRYLDLSHCILLTDDGIRYLSVLTNLRTLNLMGCKFVHHMGIAHLDNVTVSQ